MKTILENFLEVLKVFHTKQFAQALYQEHPHKHNMYGLKKMLDVYGIKTLGILSETKELQDLVYPCILHIPGDFVIGLNCHSNKITYMQHGKRTSVNINEFKQMWTGHAIVAEDSPNAIEPDYKEHLRKEIILKVEQCSIPVILVLTSIISVLYNYDNIGLFGLSRILLNLMGVMVCSLLMQKQLYGGSYYGDKVCSLFHKADCNSILDGTASKIFGFTWSEIGLGYFTANVLLLSVYPASSTCVTFINWAAMLYGLWSVYYQWRIAKNWCVLCLIVQLIIWTTGVISFIFSIGIPFHVDLYQYLLTSAIYMLSILGFHQYATIQLIDSERTNAVQQFGAIKANGDVAKILIEKDEYFETSLDDSSILFGNPSAKLRITILSNPHCNPCARMHKQVERLLKISGNDVCVQYIFSSFNEQLEDSSRYLIACYLNNTKQTALRKFARWYTKDKFDYKNVVIKNQAYIHSPKVEAEMKKHNAWCKKTSLIETPTILVNGYKLPKEYKLEELALLTNITISKKNIFQDINGRSTTPLGAE